MPRVIAVATWLLLGLCAVPAAQAAPTPYVIGFCADPRTGQPVGDKSLPPGWNLTQRYEWHTLTVDCQSAPGRTTGIHLQSVATTRPQPGTVEVVFTPPANVGVVALDYYRYMQRSDDLYVSASGSGALVDATGVAESCSPEGGCPRGAPA